MLNKFRDNRPGQVPDSVIGQCTAREGRFFPPALLAADLRHSRDLSVTGPRNVNIYIKQCQTNILETTHFVHMFYGHIDITKIL